MLNNAGFRLRATNFKVIYEKRFEDTYDAFVFGWPGPPVTQRLCFIGNVWKLADRQAFRFCGVVHFSTFLDSTFSKTQKPDFLAIWACVHFLEIIIKPTVNRWLEWNRDIGHRKGG